MKIVLNSELTRIVPREQFSLTSATIKNFSKKFIHACKINSPKCVIGAEFNPHVENLNAGWLELLANAYNTHDKVRIAPHDFWFIVMTELAAEVNTRSETYRSLFTSSTDKQTILVPTSDITSINVKSLVQALTDKINAPISLFLPELTTATQDVKAAIAATFCDMVQSYYKYGTFCCGISEIDVTGTHEDWLKLASNAQGIRKLFEQCNSPSKVVDYLNKISQLFTSIANDVKSNDPNVDFWKGIFTTKNIGSGSQLQISGWVKDLYLTKRPDNKLENFTHSVGIVPYHNVDTGREFTAIYGAFGQLRSADDFTYASYDHVVIERNPS